jgi:hypothetical protein
LRPHRAAATPAGLVAPPSRRAPPPEPERKARPTAKNILFSKKSWISTWFNIFFNEMLTQFFYKNIGFNFSSEMFVEFFKKYWIQLFLKMLVQHFSFNILFSEMLAQPFL